MEKSTRRIDSTHGISILAAMKNRNYMGKIDSTWTDMFVDIILLAATDIIGATGLKPNPTQTHESSLGRRRWAVSRPRIRGDHMLHLRIIIPRRGVLLS